MTFPRASLNTPSEILLWPRLAFEIPLWHAAPRHLSGVCGGARPPLRRPECPPALCQHPPPPGFCVCLAFPGAAPIPPRAPIPDLAPCRLLSFSGSSYLWGVLFATDVSLFPPQRKSQSKPGPGRRNWWQPRNTVSCVGLSGTSEDWGPQFGCVASPDRAPRRRAPGQAGRVLTERTAHTGLPIRLIVERCPGAAVLLSFLD